MNPREDYPGFYATSAPGTLFDDRVDAGTVLARELVRYSGRHVLVLGIPRGGVPVADAVALGLGGELDVIVVRKLRAPSQPELAIGAVTSDGTRFLNDDIIELAGVAPSYLARATAQEQAEALRREHLFRPGLPPLEVRGREVILVDDGLATGATVHAAVRALRLRQVGKLVVAIPVGAPSTCDTIAAEVDELVCPYRPEPFYAVGLYYRDFGQTSDAEVEEILRAHRERRAGAVPLPAP